MDNLLIWDSILACPVSALIIFCYLTVSLAKSIRIPVIKKEVGKKSDKIEAFEKEVGAAIRKLEEWEKKAGETLKEKAQIRKERIQIINGLQRLIDKWN